MSLDARWDQENPGVVCLDHHSIYCEHVVQLVTDRDDAPALTNMIKGYADRFGAPPIEVTIPVFPRFCVWEQISYDAVRIDGIGPVAAMTAAVPPNYLKSIKRIMPDESLGDLAMVLRQGYEDEIERLWDRIANTSAGTRLQLPWKCTSQRHSFKYQQVLEQVLAPAPLYSALKSGNNMDLQHAMLYTMMNHSRCLFCRVNERNRDAIRVTPHMAEFFPNAAEHQSSDDDFDDLVPTR